MGFWGDLSEEFEAIKQKYTIENESLSDVIYIFKIIEEKYVEDYGEILTIIERIQNKCKEEIKNCTDNNQYDEVQKIANYSKRLENTLLKNHVTQNQESVVENKEISNKSLTLYDNWAYTDPEYIYLNETKYNCFSWRDVMKQTCKVLYEIDKEKFDKIVNDDIIHGRKKSFFLRNYKSKDYCQIPGTEVYFFQAYGAEQIKNYIRKLLTIFEISSTKFRVFIREKKDKKSKIYVLQKKDQKCPKCNSELVNKKMTYMLYDTIEKKDGHEENMYIRECEHCKTKFLTEGTYNTLLKQKPDFKKRINLKVVVLNGVEN